MTRKKSQGKFEWENLAMIGIGPKETTPSPEEAKQPRIVNRMYLGQIPKNFPITIHVDGMTLVSNKISMNFKVESIGLPNNKNHISIIMELANDTIQFIELDEILTASSLKILDDLITNQQNVLCKIANEYECFNRQFYHFMYDLIGIVKAISDWNENDQNKILSETKSAQSLLHNRVHAELYSAYNSQGILISLYPDKPGSSRKPDLKIKDTFVDVKAIIISKRSKHQLLKQFALRLTDRIETQEKEKKQVDTSGTFFIAIWSGVISSTFYVVFDKMKNDKIFFGTKLYDTVPPFEKEKVVFILPHPNAFESYYFVVPRKRAVRIAEYMYKKGFDKIQKSNVYAYVTLINVRKGCPFGITGKNPNILYKVT